MAIGVKNLHDENYCNYEPIRFKNYKMLKYFEHIGCPVANLFIILKLGNKIMHAINGNIKYTLSRSKLFPNYIQYLEDIRIKLGEEIFKKILDLISPKIFKFHVLSLNGIYSRKLFRNISKEIFDEIIALELGQRLDCSFILSQNLYGICKHLDFKITNQLMSDLEYKFKIQGCDNTIREQKCRIGNILELLPFFDMYFDTLDEDWGLFAYRKFSGGKRSLNIIGNQCFDCDGYNGKLVCVDHQYYYIDPFGPPKKIKQDTVVDPAKYVFNKRDVDTFHGLDIYYIIGEKYHQYISVEDLETFFILNIEKNTIMISKNNKMYVKLSDKIYHKTDGFHVIQYLKNIGKWDMITYVTSLTNWRLRSKEKNFILANDLLLDQSINNDLSLSIDEKTDSSIYRCIAVSDMFNSDSGLKIYKGETEGLRPQLVSYSNYVHDDQELPKIFKLRVIELGNLLMNKDPKYIEKINSYRLQYNLPLARILSKREVKNLRNENYMLKTKLPPKEEKPIVNVFDRSTFLNIFKDNINEIIAMLRDHGFTVTEGKKETVDETFSNDASSQEKSNLIGEGSKSILHPDDKVDDLQVLIVPVKKQKDKQKELDLYEIFEPYLSMPTWDDVLFGSISEEESYTMELFETKNFRELIKYNCFSFEMIESFKKINPRCRLKPTYTKQRLDPNVSTKNNLLFTYPDIEVFKGVFLYDFINLCNIIGIQCLKVLEANEISFMTFSDYYISFTGLEKLFKEFNIDGDQMSIINHDGKVIINTYKELLAVYEEWMDGGQ